MHIWYNRGRKTAERNNRCNMSLTYSPLYSGSSGNASLIASSCTSVLIDAGMSGKSIVEAIHAVRFSPERLQGILITHEHSDHVKGAGVLSRRFDLPIYATEGSWCGMQKAVGEIARKNIRVFSPGQTFFVGDLEVLPFAISHDANEPVGYSIAHKGVRVSQMTDLGYVSEENLDAVMRSSLVLLESNHDIDLLETGCYPAVLKKRIRSKRGHLSNDDCGKALLRLFDGGVRRFVLGHLSGENNTETIAFSAAKQTAETNGLALGADKDIEIYMAHRDRPCGIFRVG